MSDLDTVLGALAQRSVSALVVAHDNLYINNRVQLVALVARHAIPAIYSAREFVEAGGLMSYGTSNTDEYRQSGIYVGKILKGTKPSDLPVMQSTKFELVINLRAAKALGLELPATLLTLANEVIE